MPLLITDQILVKQVPKPDGAALLLRSTPNAETGAPVETQWFITRDQASCSYNTCSRPSTTPSRATATVNGSKPPGKQRRLGALQWPLLLFTRTRT